MLRNYPRDILLLPLIGLVIGLALLPHYEYLLTGDGIAYISIAGHYLAGDMQAAVNGYWSPMLSWLLVPLMGMGLDGVFAIKLINLVVACLTIGVLGHMLRKWGLALWWRVGCMAAAIPLTIFHAYYTCTPDLLAAFILLLYFDLILHENTRMDRSVLLGIIGGLAFLTKAYCFWFFLAHFVFTTAWRSTQPAFRMERMKSALVTLLVFGILSGSWIAGLSWKYGEPKLSYAYSYNKATMVSQSTDPFVFNAGLLKPPHPRSINILEDYTGLTFETWSMFDSKEMFLFQLGSIWQNLLSAKSYLGYHTLLVFIAALFLAVYHFRKGMARTSPFATCVTFIAIYIAGYSLLIMQFRYLFIVELLTLAIGALLLWKITNYLPFSKVQRYLSLSALLVALIFHPIRYLHASAGSGAEVHGLAADLETLDLKGRIASNSEYVRSLYVCHWLNLPYYGIPKPEGQDGKVVLEQLEEHQIKYIMVWGSAHTLPENYHLIYNNPELDLRLLEMKSDGE